MVPGSSLLEWLAEWSQTISAIGSVFLSLALVYLYYQQKNISKEQASIQRRQERLLEKGHRPVIVISCELNSNIPKLVIQNSGGGTAVDVFAEIAVENEIRTWACPVMSSGESATLPLLKSQKPNKTYSYTEEVFDRINHSTKMKVAVSCENTLHEKEKFVKEFSIKERIEKLQDTEDATTRSELDSIDDSLINIDRNLGRIKSELKR